MSCELGLQLIPDIRMTLGGLEGAWDVCTSKEVGIAGICPWGAKMEKLKARVLRS
jgi:hypothetical protein